MKKFLKIIGDGAILLIAVIFIALMLFRFFAEPYDAPVGPEPIRAADVVSITG